MSKRKTQDPFEIIAAEREKWDQWRRKNGKHNDFSEPAEVVRVRQIAEALDSLRWKDQPTGAPPSALVLAVCDDRWDLIRKAADLLAMDFLPRLDPRRLSHDAKWIAFCLSLIESPKLGKADILEYIEAVHPEIFATIPRTIKARTTWWAEVGGEQVRESVSPEWKRQFAALISNAIRIKKAGFPDFLGPRDRPNWE